MGYQPRSMIRHCPGCGQSAQFLKFRGLFSCDVRLECPCGVSGQWRNWSPDQHRDAWHDAVVGWADVFGQAEMKRPPPPASMRIRTRGWQWDTP